MLDIGRSDYVQAVAFHPDGMHLLCGSDGGIRRWRLADGQEVGKQTGTKLRAISVSRDGKWVACGSREGGASLWDAELHEKVVDVEGENSVYAVDVSPDSTRLATGTGFGDYEASIWSITTGERLVGPLKHDRGVTGIRFSPNGERIATCSHGGSVCIFDSRNGDQLLDIKTDTASTRPITPLVWSNDGQRIFTVSNDKRIRSFAASTGTQLAESPILNNNYSIALAGNGRFISTVAMHTISFLDTSTLVKIGTSIEDSERMWSIAISFDSSQIATGRADGKIIVHNLASFLPDSYSHSQVRNCLFIMLACWKTTIPY